MITYHKRFLIFSLFLACCLVLPGYAADAVGIWAKFEQPFTSTKEYANPLYEVKKFTVKFTSPTGRVKNINGFWDGGRNWKVRFAPDEKGTWTWESDCSDTGNTGLKGVKGSFNCTSNKSKLAIYQHGEIIHPKGTYHLTHANGTPFFWTGCTAWNGTLKSTETEWDTYLTHRAQNGYNVIQFVTTQWRGGDKNSLGQVAFEGSGKIKINPAFFQHLDGKIDKINEHGLVAAPVLLWALGAAQGRELSPGYYLPEEEAILLARYMVARYSGNQVIWVLGGDGKYTDENEQRWKNIGRTVFKDEHPGLVALHPGGGSWIGEAYAHENWLDIIGYQSGHNSNPRTINFMNKGPVATTWSQLPPRPLINMEPVYEEIGPNITATDVRNASYWSVLSAPVAGITYGANGIWPWLREGEEILNHAGKGEDASRWHQGIKLPGSMQVGYLANFMRTLDWWNLKPSPELLMAQPGDQQPAAFVSVSRSTDGKTIVVYLPKATPVKLYNLHSITYEAQWFNPVANKTTKGKVTATNGTLEIMPPAGDNDYVLVLKKKN
ncbi:apiosidase-like domain-containing protein [Adhaeribacter rhizoryzae]|uniref:DUF4038 domain-containing protein n=1 Tax=Adhaeribacter rhizoryzae TaxID=2607907 RepID=A0A5M6D4S5_9BACT|nr:DUF4038 domain-containing protein [Adhaeribacter rhizoryzae]KAA5541590.1 DUF4038 domain-containing protein [Adhaeribacter rhizoryzae]